MNKRLIKKKTREKNRGRVAAIFDAIQSKFTICNVIYGNGYLVFRDVDTVIHFCIKEIKDWKFGIWLQNNTYEIFGEHVGLIDKFKPSMCYISTDDVNKFIDTLVGIYENPKYHFVNSYTYGDAESPWKEIDLADGEISYAGYQAVKVYDDANVGKYKVIRDTNITLEDFIEQKYIEYIEYENKEKQHEEEDWNKVFNIFKNDIFTVSDKIIAVGIKDNNVGSHWCCIPRYGVNIVVEKGITQDELNNLYDILDEYISKVSDSDNFKTNKHTFKLEMFYDELSDISYCHYKYKK